MSFVKPQSMPRDQFAQYCPGRSSPPLSVLPGDFPLKAVFLKHYKVPMKLPRARIHDVASW